MVLTTSLSCRQCHWQPLCCIDTIGRHLDRITCHKFPSFTLSKLIARPFHTASLLPCIEVNQAFVLPLGLTALLCYAEAASLPASPTMVDRRSKGRSSLESLKRAREVLETPLALRLDVLAGPACNKSYTTDPGVTQVSHDYCRARHQQCL